MPQEIYNEGRVVGLSAWELYMREALANGVAPKDVPTEPEWLASMIGSGASMILRIPANTSSSTPGVHDFKLPEGSNLSAAGVVVASPFFGECQWDNSNWAKKVISYGPLILNESGVGTAPSPDGGSVPSSPYYFTSEYNSIVSEYVKIADGIVYTKNATWIRTETGTPYEDIDPNFNQSSTYIRLYLDTYLQNDVYILFTGFTNKRILQGLSGYAGEDSGHSVGGSTDTEHNNWKNGGMLGPEIIPWSSKIIFTVPNAAYILGRSMTRTLPSDMTYTDTEFNIDGIAIHDVQHGTVKSNPILDFASIDLVDYYAEHNADFISQPRLTANIDDVAFVGADDTNALIAWYPGMTAKRIMDEASAVSPSNERFFPPALYAAQITGNGYQELVPIDIAAPGTLKVFKTDTEADNYKSLLPDNYAMYYDAVNNTASFATYNEHNSKNWLGLAKIDFVNNGAPKAELTAGRRKSQFIALSDPNGVPYATDGTNGVLAIGPANNPSWDNLMSAIVTNKTIDVLGDRLHKSGVELESNDHTLGIAANNPINKVGATYMTLQPNTAAEVNITSSCNANVDPTKFVNLPNGSTVQVGSNFIEFTDTTNNNNKIRLYICSNNPGTANVPEGSIGIGWVQ